MKRFLVPVVAAAALAAPAAWAAKPAQGPGAFVVWELRSVQAGHWPQLWKRIHPAQRKHVNEVLYVACNAQVDTGWTFARIQVTAVRSVRAALPGTKLGRIPATAVTVRLGLRSVDGRTTTAKQTVNVFRVKGVWYSALTAAQFKAYKAGKCLGLPATG